MFKMNKKYFKSNTVKAKVIFKICFHAEVFEILYYT